MVFVPIPSGTHGPKDAEKVAASTGNGHLVLTVLSMLLLFTGLALLAVS